MGKDSENYKYNDAKNTPEDNSILEDRKKTSQVEEEQVTVEPTKMQRNDDIIEERNSYMFGRSFNVDDHRRKKASDAENKNNVNEKDLSTDKFPDVKDEMRAVRERKDAATRLTRSRILSQERFPGGGKVMKPKRGTPNKLNNVKKLRKIFEISSSSPATEGYVELLSQSNKGLNPTNLSTTTGCTRLKPKFCVSQPGGGTQTGPRQDGLLELQLSQDWPSQNRLGLGDQSGEMCQGQVVGDIKSE